MATSASPGRFKNISPKAYEHPADRAATAALGSIPMLDKVTDYLVEYGYERRFKQSLLGGAIKLGERQLPDVWSTYLGVLETLDMDEVYDLYLTNEPIGLAMAVGSGKPVVVVGSRLASMLDPDEMRTVLAHEAAHILSGHVRYRTALEIILMVGHTLRLPFIAGVPLIAIRAALLEWARATELSSDRAATLVNGDPLITCRTLMSLAGGMSSDRLDLDAFLAQAEEFEKPTDHFDRISRYFLQSRVGHPIIVRRCREIQAWVQSGDFDRIMSGDYVRRGSEPPVRVEAGAAAEDYSRRFADIFRDAGEAMQGLTEQLGLVMQKSGQVAGDFMQKGGQTIGDWLRGTKPPSEEDGDSE
jgi:Zn-dependent protease with chaperone function